MPNVLTTDSAENNPILRDGTPNLRTLMEQSWAMPHAGATPRIQFETNALAMGFPPPRVALETDSADAIVSLVARSQIFGWLPLPMLEGALNAGQIRLVEAPGLEWRREFRPYRRARGSFPQAAQVLVNALGQC